jgi:NADP-reducing hydrogenase subunit HndD
MLHAGDPNKVVVAAIAPSVRVTICESIKMPEGAPLQNLEKKLITAFRQMGFDFIFDTAFAADLTIMEEGTELIHR